MQVEVLARAHGLLVQAGLMTWGQVEMYATRPFHARTFWKHANTLYRHFTVFFLAHTLQVLPTAAAYMALHIPPNTHHSVELLLGSRWLLNLSMSPVMYR